MVAAKLKVILLAITIVSASTGVTHEKETLHLGVLVSQDGEFDNSGFIPALHLALQTIENDASFQYKFDVRIDDSMCAAASSLRSFIDQIFNRSQIILIGSDCSVATEPVAEIAPNWNLVQISAASSSPRLSNSNIFPLFLRTVSSDAEIAVGITAAMKEFGWSRVALITQSENIFTFFSTEFKIHLNEVNLQLLEEVTFNTDESVELVVRELRNSPARIIFLNMYQEYAIRVMCEALKHNMAHPTHAWMFFNWYPDNWWFDNSCTKNDTEKKMAIEDVLSTSLIFDHYPRIDENDKDKMNVGNISFKEFVSYHNEAFPKLGRNASSQLEDSAYMFDAVWAVALALNNTDADLLNFTYDGENAINISQSIYQELINVEFFGLTGNVSFRDNGDRPGKIRVLQYRWSNGNLTKVQFGTVEKGSLVFDDNESVTTVFTDDIVDDEEHFYISLPLFVVYTMLSLLGVLFSIICLVFNLWFRKQKLVKLGSPYVNVMIIAGAVIFYITVIFFGVDENVASSSTVDHLCQTKVWLVAIGFSLLFGTIFAKTWRIYFIFNYIKPKTKLEMKDIYLFAIVGVLILVDIVILIPPTAVSSAILRREQEEVEGEDAGDLPGIIGVCTSDNSLPWITVLLAYKGLVLLAGLFLAFETRKVKIRSLNESRFVAMSVYGAVTASIALTPIGFLLNDFPNIQYGIMGIMLLFVTTLILGLVFVSKMYKVYRDPEGANYLEQSHSNVSSTTKTTVKFSEDDYKKRIEDLNFEIKGLTKELEMFKSHQDTTTLQEHKMKTMSGDEEVNGNASPLETHL
ncbi:gamma-aminobutyric acid type B receptor subunit 2-like [Dysidea avara]|uniref:gamma-aminobutyric acid type B receptor subunit 2-like n=1 Tax=Dysidea avara TaxID=196820 RepID=UPI00332BBCE0